MDRYWLLTTTFYGNWLPGDPRGFVSRVRDRRPEEQLHPASHRHEHNVPGTEIDRDFPELHRIADAQRRGPAIRVTRDHAEVMHVQFLETAGYRGWRLVALAIMVNHVHLVVGVMGDPDPTKILGDLKAFASRSLNQRWGKPASGTWWTYAGSKRKLDEEASVTAAVAYVRDQPFPLLVWVDPEFNS